MYIPPNLYDQPGNDLRPARTPSQDKCKEDLPACPVCQGLECLCRPRFFPGQLLTDEDLNRLQRYIIGKNKLHNRYLHGWGVACGLEVVCDPCKSTNVIVRTGYALSPCGDDIVVCKDHSVNVCELIQQCREPKESACDPPYSSEPADCGDEMQTWVLAICYDETPSRGVTALTGSTDSACGSSCGCGGSGSCGCGGTATSAKKSNHAHATGKSKKSYNAQCEPTQICEGYRFVAYRAPRTKTSMLGEAAWGNQYGTSKDMLWAWMYANRAKFGPLLERVLCCVIRAMELRAQIREGKAIGREAVNVYMEYAQALQEFARDFALHRCTFVTKTRQQYEEANTYVRGIEGKTFVEADLVEVKSRLVKLDTTWTDIIAECFCSALLPACPPPATSNCVPLATVAVRMRDCSVVEICNWTERKLLITWPTVTYWLSWLPWDQLRRWIAMLCCGPRRGRSIYSLLTVMLGVAASGMKARKLERVDAKMDVDMLDMAMRGEAAMKYEASYSDRVDAAMNADNFLLHALGDFDRLRTGTDAELPAWASLAARLIDGSALASLAGNAAVADVNVKDLALNLGLTKMQTQIEELQKTVEAQKKIIDALDIVRKYKE